MLLNEMTPQSACEEINESVRHAYQEFAQGNINRQDTLAELSYLREDLDLRWNMIEHTDEDAELFIATKLFIKIVTQQVAKQPA